MDTSPRRPSRTMRIFSSAEYCLRVARRMSRTSRSDGVSGVLDFGLMLHSSGGHDEPEILRSSSRSFCLTDPDVGHSKLATRITRHLTHLGQDESRPQSLI